MHVDEYRVYNDIPSVASPFIFNGLVNSAVSPVYGNNPNFRVASYSQKNFSVTGLDLSLHLSPFFKKVLNKFLHRLQYLVNGSGKLK